jgi:hypothetical protein
MGMTGGYVADVANAQEVNVQISGALGESETGGPRSTSFRGPGAIDSLATTS